VKLDRRIRLHSVSQIGNDIPSYDPEPAWVTFNTKAPLARCGQDRELLALSSSTAEAPWPTGA